MKRNDSKLSVTLTSTLDSSPFLNLSLLVKNVDRAYQILSLVVVVSPNLLNFNAVDFFSLLFLAFISSSILITRCSVPNAYFRPGKAVCIATLVWFELSNRF